MSRLTISRLDYSNVKRETYSSMFLRETAIWLTITITDCNSWLCGLVFNEACHFELLSRHQKAVWASRDIHS